QDWSCREKPDLGQIQIELSADRDTRHSEHRPHRETGGECPGGHEQNRESSGLRHLYLSPPRKRQRAIGAPAPAPRKTSLPIVLHVWSACVVSAAHRSPFLSITPCEFAMPSSRLSAMRQDNRMKRSAAACGQTSCAVCANRASHRSKCWASIGNGRCRAMGSP